VITVVSVSGLVTVQDGGRPRHMHQGVPPGGALVPELLARANVAVGNDANEAGLEVFGSIALTGSSLAGGPLVASDDGLPVDLAKPREGDAWRVVCAGARVRYVAVRGGIDVPRVLGGRGTLLGAGFGGTHGRELRLGDILRVGDAPTVTRAETLPPAPDGSVAIRVLLGPDLHRFHADAVRLLLTSEFVIDGRSDRVGIRLTGPILPRTADDDTGVSAPMVRGAIQVPSSGVPIVLDPDHPTMGGYPVLATVVRASFGALGARRVGAAVRFVTDR